MKKSLFVVLLLVVFMASIFLFRLESKETSGLQISTDLDLTQAANYLQRLYNSSIGLCRETLGHGELEPVNASGIVYQHYPNETYWIASDNYLDSLALSPYNLTLSENISKTCRTYYNGSYVPYQIMQGEPIPLAFSVYNAYVFKNTSDYIVALDLCNGTINASTFLNYPIYGDTLVYEALNYYVQGYPIDWCNNLYMEAYNMFDGKGVADFAYRNSNASERFYNNMKLALLIFGAKVLNDSVDLTGVENQLSLAQITNGSEVGGITACMNSSGQPVGTANGETTALTLLAYDYPLISQLQTERKEAYPHDSISVTFPAATFNRASQIQTNVTVVPLLTNWTVTFNNTVQWTENSSRVAQEFESLTSEGNISIQIIEYYNSSASNKRAMDVVLHNTTTGNSTKISPANLSWSNPLTVSLISGVLKVSCSVETFTYPFQGFRLAYIFAGSTESHNCSGGEVDDQAVPEFPVSLIVPLFMISTLLAVITFRKNRVSENHRVI